MADLTITIVIPNAKVTAANMNGFLETNPLPETNPPDVSDDAGKESYITSKAVAWLNAQVKVGRQRIESRAAKIAVPDEDMSQP